MGGRAGSKDEFRGGVVGGIISGLSMNAPAAAAPEEKGAFSRSEGLRNGKELNKVAADRASLAQAIPRENLPATPTFL